MLQFVSRSPGQLPTLDSARASFLRRFWVTAKEWPTLQTTTLGRQPTSVTMSLSNSTLCNKAQSMSLDPLISLIGRTTNSRGDATHFSLSRAWALWAKPPYRFGNYFSLFWGLPSNKRFNMGFGKNLQCKTSSTQQITNLFFGKLCRNNVQLLLLLLQIFQQLCIDFLKQWQWTLSYKPLRELVLAPGPSHLSYYLCVIIHVASIMMDNRTSIPYEYMSSSLKENGIAESPIPYCAIIALKW